MNKYIQTLVNNPWIVNNMLSCIYVYNNIRDYVNDIYNTNTLFRSTVDFIYVNGHKIMCNMFNVKYGPESTNWYTNCVLYEHNHNNNSLYFMVESYNILPNYFDKQNISQILDDANETLEEKYTNYGSICDSLFIMKYYNSIISKMNIYTNVKIDDIEKSDVKFLAIEYSHPLMKYNITLHLDDSYIVVGNELFSSCFIKRMLDYQFKSYIFDNRYKLVIIDNDTNEYVLTYNTYMNLERSKCIVNAY